MTPCQADDFHVHNSECDDRHMEGKVKLSWYHRNIESKLVVEHINDGDHSMITPVCKWEGQGKIKMVPYRKISIQSLRISHTFFAVFFDLVSFRQKYFLDKNDFFRPRTIFCCAKIIFSINNRPKTWPKMSVTKVCNPELRWPFYWISGKDKTQP